MRKQYTKEQVKANGGAFLPRYKVGSERRQEILRLHARGKSIADICVWMNIPMSAVSQVIKDGV